jgi:hypothetical protein
MAPSSKDASGSLDTEQRGTKAMSPTKAGATPTQSTPSTDIENEKETDNRGTDEFDSEESTTAALIEYPKGSHLVLVTTALVLSVFLVALDQVGIRHIFPFLISLVRTS